MGNKLGKRKQTVDERFTRPQGLYIHKDVDIKKLRKLIVESKLAPCYPGEEECRYDLEECPICFLYYPSLNRSRCCTKGICTECFLQMKNPNTARPTQCPFCKTANYAVEYRGLKTKEEKGMEQIEEQRVIEAKIRMRQQELHEDEEKFQRRQELCSSSSTIVSEEIEYDSTTALSNRSTVEIDEIVSSQESCPVSTVRQHLQSRANREDEFDIDLEDIMVMEAIWLSIQTGKQKNLLYSDTASSEQYVTEDHYISPNLAPVSGSSSSPSGGLACAIAALAERQQMSGESSDSHNGNATTTFNMHPGSSSTSRYYNNLDMDAENYTPAESSSHASPGGRMMALAPSSTDVGQWSIDPETQVGEVGTSYISSGVTEDAGGISPSSQPDENGVSFQNGQAPIVPDSFEEQMMLAMAVSLAEARAITNAQGVSWQ